MNLPVSYQDALVIGYGNPLRGDDGAGWLAAEKLDSLLSADGIEVIIRHQLTPELAETISRKKLVVFIDASVTSEPGVVVRNVLQPAESAEISLLHEFDPKQLLAAAKQLYGSYPPAILYSIGGKNFEMGETLTEPVAEGVGRAVQLVMRELKEGARTLLNSQEAATRSAALPGRG